MFPPDTKQTVFTIEFSVAAYAHYMGMDHEEAGKEMAAPDFMGGLSFIEKTPRGLYFKACPDSPGFYSKETIRKAIREGKTPNGENKLLIQAKCFVHLLDEKVSELELKLDFQPDDFSSHDDFFNFPEDVEEIYCWFQRERNSANVARHERDDARAQTKEKDAEIERLKQEIAELKTRQAMNAALTPGNPLFQYRMLIGAILNKELNDPPPGQMRDIKAAISDFLTSLGIAIERKGTIIEYLAWLIAQRECGKPIEEAPEWAQIIFNATGHGAMLGFTGKT